MRFYTGGAKGVQPEAHAPPLGGNWEKGKEQAGWEGGYFDPPKPKRLRREGKEGEKGGKQRRKEGRTVLKMGILAFKRAHKQN